MGTLRWRAVVVRKAADSCSSMALGSLGASRAASNDKSAFPTSTHICSRLAACARAPARPAAMQLYAASPSRDPSPTQGPRRKGVEGGRGKGLRGCGAASRLGWVVQRPPRELLHPPIGLLQRLLLLLRPLLTTAQILLHGSATLFRAGGCLAGSRQLGPHFGHCISARQVAPCPGPLCRFRI